MKKVRGFIKIVAVIWLSIMLLSGCSYSIGSIKLDSQGKIDRTYVTFNGKDNKSIELKEGETLVLEYKATVKKGALSLKVTDPDNQELWGVRLVESKEGEVEIPAKTTGTYVLNMVGEKTGGGLHIKITKK